MNLNQCPCSGKTLGRLLQPAILAVLANGPVHGYRVAHQVGRLEMFHGQSPDPTGVYRALKAMQSRRLVLAKWDLSEAGPAKREYRLTRTGKDCLARWVCTLAGYRDAIDDLLGMARRASRRRAAVRLKKA
jgi:DNA-binding PadR family transcriptional regulator